MNVNETWNVTIDIVITGDDGTAHAALTKGSGEKLEGYGRARRNPDDEPHPEVGMELAAARALRDLADRLLKATSDDLSRFEHHRVRLAR
ncbi:dsRBD fold-containing protein [Georgenia sp. AZ-5]|uniref:dsRBD fold-containing protein n=1 Tax=Georgenia sp. AZ-5 TaxID=3367526 RepID=UPI0037551B7A